MNQDIVKLIDRVKEDTLKRKTVGKSDLLSLMNIDYDSKEADYMGAAAREVATKVVGNKGNVWSAIGVDYIPCSMNCNFCSFGEKWGVIENAHEWTPEEILDTAGKFITDGAHWVTLRTTQFYDKDRLRDIVRLIRKTYSGDYEIVINTGEFDLENAEKMKQSGVDVVYHSLRLGEGCDTAFDIQDRLDTLDAVHKSPLKHAFLVEPVGVEHTNEQIVDVFLTNMKYGAVLSGSMARVNIPGTPFADQPALPDRRLAQIVAMTRLGGGWQTPDICVHPPTQIALEWGANVMVVETGAVPREKDEPVGEWKRFGVKDAMMMFDKAGYDL